MSLIGSGIYHRTKNRIHNLTILLSAAAPGSFFKKNVIFMVYSLYGGGAERVVSRLASELAGKYKVSVLCCEDKGRKYSLPPDVEYKCIPEFLGPVGERPELIRKYVSLFKRSRKPVACISFMYAMNKLNVLTRGYGKTICSERNYPAKREPEHMDEIRKFYEEADLVVFQTEAQRELFGEKVKEHSVIIPNPVSVECGSAKEKRHRIVNIGRLNIQKNQKLLIRAFSVFYRTHPEYMLSIYGDGEMKEELEELAGDLGISNAVIFHGNKEHIHEEIKDAEMFVLSSDFEGMPNALLECMMMGIPCITAAYAGAEEIVTDGENGLITETGNVEMLSLAMGRLADDPDLRKKIGENARRSAQGHKQELIAEKWMEIVG